MTSYTIYGSSGFCVLRVIEKVDDKNYLIYLYLAHKTHYVKDIFLLYRAIASKSIRHLEKSLLCIDGYL
ncbi:MAG: hypothetical protein KAS66_03305, partial [Candidatus Omnitrophica bacterium]|nr:hypothetical protein [Candidatus Omnitrophota bacterium]